MWKHVRPFTFQHLIVLSDIQTFLRLCFKYMSTRVTTYLYLSITVVPIYYSAAPSIDRKDVSLPSPFLGRQASLTKGNFASVSPYYKMQYRVIDVV